MSGQCLVSPSLNCPQGHCPCPSHCIRHPAVPPGPSAPRGWVSVLLIPPTLCPQGCPARGGGARTPPRGLTILVGVGQLATLPGPGPSWAVAVESSEPGLEQSLQGHSRGAPPAQTQPHGEGSVGPSQTPSLLLCPSPGPPLKSTPTPETRGRPCMTRWGPEGPASRQPAPGHPPSWHLGFPAISHNLQTAPRPQAVHPQFQPRLQNPLARAAGGPAQAPFLQGLCLQDPRRPPCCHGGPGAPGQAPRPPRFSPQPEASRDQGLCFLRWRWRWREGTERGYAASTVCPIPLSALSLRERPRHCDPILQTSD